MTSKATGLFTAKVSKLAYDLRILNAYTTVVRDKKVGFRLVQVLESKSHSVQRWLVCMFQLLFRTCMISYGVYFDLSHPELGKFQSFTFYIVMMTDIISAFSLVSLSMFGRLFYDMVVLFQHMEHKLKIIHGFRGDEPDGAEKYLKTMVVVMGSVTACVPFINFELVQLKVHVFGQMKTPFGIGALVFAVSGASVIFVSWLVMLIMIQAALVYVNSTILLLRMLRWRPELESGKKDAFIFAYRMHQVIHILATQSSSAIIAFALCAVAVLMTVILVLLIGFSAKTPVMILFAVACTFLVAMLATRLLLNLATYITDTSADFPNSFLQNDLELNAAQSRALKACPPLTLKIGPFSTISRDTFPFLMSDIVMSQTVDILVGYKETGGFD